MEVDLFRLISVNRTYILTHIQQPTLITQQYSIIIEQELSFSFLHTIPIIFTAIDYCCDAVAADRLRGQGLDQYCNAQPQPTILSIHRQLVPIPPFYTDNTLDPSYTTPSLRSLPSNAFTAEA